MRLMGWVDNTEDTAKKRPVKLKTWQQKLRKIKHKDTKNEKHP